MSTTYYDPINNRQKDASLFTGGLTGGRLSFERGFSHFYKVTNVLSGPRAGLEGVALPLRSDTHRSYDGTKEGIASSPFATAQGLLTCGLVAIREDRFSPRHTEQN